MLTNPYLSQDIAHATADDQAWLKDIAIDGRALEIALDASTLGLAIVEMVYGTTPFDPASFLTAQCGLTQAQNDAELLQAAKAFKAELLKRCHVQAKAEIEDEAQHMEENPYAIERDELSRLDVPLFLKQQGE